MSGGALFDYTWPNLEEADGKWRDEEINGLYHDLFVGAEFSVRGHGGLIQSLDFLISSDISEDSYREKVARFKDKWFKRTPKTRRGRSSRSCAASAGGSGTIRKMSWGSRTAPTAGRRF